MDHIDQELATGSLNETFQPSIRAALELAKNTLN